MMSRILLGASLALLGLPACRTTGAGTVEGERQRMLRAEQAATQAEIPKAKGEPMRGVGEDQTQPDQPPKDRLSSDPANPGGT